jgi:hypothetical protein
MGKKWIKAMLIGGGLALLCGGCTVTKMTEPPRSASEQFLLSTAADRAIAKADLSGFANQKVFLDNSNFDSYDPKYVIGSIRDALNRAGALLVSAAAQADIILEPRSGGLSIDSSSSLLGIPSTGLPVPLAGAVSIPEIAIYKSDKDFSTAKLALLAYTNKTGGHFYSSGPLVGKAFDKNFKLIGMISWVRTDIPEEKPVKKHKKHEE